MCGITGVLCKDPRMNILERVKRMNLSIAHRGKDSDGVSEVIKNRVCMGHRRLSIIDPSEAGFQPKLSKSKRWVLVYNGEIYNFKEIRKHLLTNKVLNSDTEVIIFSIEQYGIDWLLSKANGMFAIGIYDKWQNKLHLIRDRIGIKPLYYYYDKEVFIFGSEIKAILHSGLIEPEFNEDAIDEYLANRYTRAPFTFFKNILQVLPAEHLIIDLNLKINKSIYWKLPRQFNIETSYNEEELTNKFEYEIIKSIKYRLISDVPLGTYLSGGVDSSLITAITANNTPHSLNTYTIGFKELNEFNYAKHVSNKYNTKHKEIIINQKDYYNQWESLIRIKDSPLGVPNEIPLAIMSSVLKRNISVVLSGEGADELMGGYGRIFRSAFDFNNHKIAGTFYNYFINNYEYVSRNMRNQFLRASQKYRIYFDEKISSDFSKLNNSENIFRFFHNYHIQGLLQRVDMATMQATVEARVPFLDHNLIEFVYKEIPYELKLKWLNNKSKTQARKLYSSEYSEELDVPKYLLRKVANKYLPVEIIKRKKVGFPVPLSDWFNFFDNKAMEILQDTDWLKKGVVKSLIQNCKNDIRSGQILWMFINIELFRKAYFTKTWLW